MTFHRMTPTTMAATDITGNRVDGCGLDLSGEFDRLLAVSGKPLQSRVEDAAGFACGNQIREQRVERSRVLPHGVGKRTSFDVGACLKDDGSKIPVWLLRAKHLEALHERQACINHDRELARKNGRLFADAFLPVFPTFVFGANAREFILVGVMRVTKI